MHRRVLSITLSTVAFLVAIGFAEEQRKPPKKPDQPFRVFVYTEGLTNEDVDMPRVAKEVSKRIAKKKKWLKVVDSRDGVDIVVEVLTHFVDEQSRTILDYRVDDQGVGKHLYETRTLASGIASKRGSHSPTETRRYSPVPTSASAAVV